LTFWHGKKYAAVNRGRSRGEAPAKEGCLTEGDAKKAAGHIDYVSGWQMHFVDRY
jgi:hypothetical protein